MSLAMSKHIRTASWEQAAYMGASASMYNPRLGMSASSYYSDMTPAPPPLDQDPSGQQQHQHQQQQHPSAADYSGYETASAPAVVHPHHPHHHSHHPAMVAAHHRASSGAWNQDEDNILREARQRGLNWNQIQAKYFPKKTPNACRKRHERLMDREGLDDFDNRKWEAMAKEYMNMRKEIWQPLASVVGEKWNVVESKILQNGLKNIQSASRAATRRERLASGQPLPPNFDNDGLDGMDGMGVDDIGTAYNSPEMAHSQAGSVNGGPDGPIAPSAPPSTYSTSHHLQLPPYYGSSGHGHGHGYTSSVSSNGTAATGYSMGGHHSRSHSASHETSPYDHQRLPSVDMGIDAIINRPIVGSSAM